MRKESLPLRGRELDHRRDDVEKRVAAAFDEELRLHSVKELARAAEISESRVKQMRAAGADPKLSTGILLAQRCPRLRALLTELMLSECGDAERSPAQVLDEIARWWRR